MLQFTDLNHEKHCINFALLNNVVFREKDDCSVVSFHMQGHHVVPVSVDRVTAERLHKELGEME
ncbi:hypothetical protein CDG60_12380 [Acinetobacter chinensis]|uniref:Uncharacterized protein n=1 Tax=Acinetobacter chinensis TaxID=2004650 RepID=A0A3B7LZD4_9GAMM|nr:hypothetical protein [Acinetobacter chinensis]AXY57294.1 hypothetical protein CDG60_12380 [Acinetobacter chinensis]